MKVAYQRIGLPCKIVSPPILEIFVLEKTLLQQAALGQSPMMHWGSVTD